MQCAPVPYSQNGQEEALVSIHLWIHQTMLMQYFLRLYHRTEFFQELQPSWLIGPGHQECQYRLPDRLDGGRYPNSNCHWNHLNLTGLKYHPPTIENGHHPRHVLNSQYPMLNHHLGG